jgi:hypothetical protein
MATTVNPPFPTTPNPLGTNETSPAIAYEDQLLKREPVAAWLGVHPDTLGIWDRQRRGPKVTRIGRTKVRYRVGDVLQWLSSQRDSPLQTRKKSNTTQREQPPPRPASKRIRSADLNS